MRIRFTSKSYFLSQPHQPFFVLGTGHAIVMMLLFALGYKGVISLEVDVRFFHLYSLAFLVFLNVFNGFLFTTFPRFNQSRLLEHSFYIRIFIFNILGALLFVLGALFSIYLLYAGMLVLFIVHSFSFKELYHIYRLGQAPDKSDSFWILVAHSFALLAQLLFMVWLLFEKVALFHLATAVTLYLFLVFLAFSVAQRMVPFFSHSMVAKRRYFVVSVFWGLVLKTLFSLFELALFEACVDLFLGIFIAWELFRWKLHPFGSPAILWVLHLALFWMPVAFWVSALVLVFDIPMPFAALHILALGFLTTLFIGFATRVTLGHAKQAPHADVIATALFILIQFVLLFRLLYSFNIAFFWGVDFLFDLSFTAWVMLFSFWLWRYAKVLIFGKSL